VEPTIIDAEAAHRYEARIDGDLAGFDYRLILFVADHPTDGGR
jgi:hypothetical protein